MGARQARARLAAPWLAAALLAALLAAGGARPAAALDASAGWALADVGLHDGRGGPVLGLGSRTPLLPAVLDLAYALEYVQKRGAQPTWFADPVDAFILDDAVVTLHVAQPSAMLELAALPPGLPRPGLGLAAGLKLAEEWSDFPGAPSEAWGYRDIDFAAIFGLSHRLGPVRLDLRHSRGLTDQLIVDPRGGALPDKAEDPLPGVEAPREGARISHWQLTAAFGF